MSGVGATADSAGDPEVVGSGQTQLCKSGREFGGTDRGVGGRVGEGVQCRYGGGGEADIDGVGVNETDTGTSEDT